MNNLNEYLTIIVYGIVQYKLLSTNSFEGAHLAKSGPLLSPI